MCEVADSGRNIEILEARVIFLAKTRVIFLVKTPIMQRSAHGSPKPRADRVGAAARV